MKLPIETLRRMSVQDITGLFHRAFENAKAMKWTEGDSFALLRRLGEKFADCKIECAAGDRWGVLGLLNGCCGSVHDIQGMVLMQAPLVLLQQERMKAVQDALGESHLVLGGFEKAEMFSLSVERKVLEEYLGVDLQREKIDYGALSPDILYWATV